MLQLKSFEISQNSIHISLNTDHLTIICDNDYPDDDDVCFDYDHDDYTSPVFVMNLVDVHRK